MVDFKTRIFSEDDGQIIGAEVLVYSDNGNKIGTIDIADATTLNELKQQLQLIDETYFTEERLKSILANQSEDTSINATKLNGFISSEFAKVSHLNNYALSNHTHVKSNITNLYDYGIASTNYNPNIDSDINIIVTVRDSRGNLAIGQPVEILKDNESWKTGTTNSSGQFVATYNCSDWGLVTFSANNKSIQVNADGWRHVLTASTYNIYRNKNFAKLELNNWVGSGGGSTWTEMGGAGAYLAKDVRPQNIVNGLISDGRVVFYISPSTGGIFHKSMTNAGYSNIQMNMTLMWSIRDEDLKK